jgi:thiosulfate dehydrogenase (quinone) large subunit
VKNLSAFTTGQLVLNSGETSRLAALSWRARGIAALRICFGLMWVVAAWLKWQPGFISNFVSMIAGVANGQPGLIQTWIRFWVLIVSINPSLIAYGAAVVETLIAAFLVLGIFSNLTYIVGIVYTLGIWSVAEGFGGPYTPGQSTDVGTALPYAVLFGVLLCVSAGRYFAGDQWLTPKLGRWGLLASASLRRKTNRRQNGVQPEKE